MSFSTLRSRSGSLRRSAVAVVASLGLLSLAACGGEDGAFSGITFEAGAAGEAPELEFEDDFELDIEESSTKVLTEGDGEEVSMGDTVVFHYVQYNGFSTNLEFSSYPDPDQEGDGEAPEPEPLKLEDGLAPWVEDALTGHAVGSKVATAAAPDDVYGPDSGRDPIIFVTEVVKKLSDEEVAEHEAAAEKAAKEAEEAAKKLEEVRENGPKAARGKKVDPAAWAPDVTYRQGQEPVIDFDGIPEPNGKLQVTKLIQGNGPEVKAGQTLLVQYVGQVFGSDAPFDSSYKTGEPAQFPIGVGQVIPGWDRALVGEKVGSRVIVQIPPALGYGEAGNEGAGIGGTDTIVFAVDILAAA